MSAVIDPIVSEYEQRLAGRALDALVETMMNGECYPRRGSNTICLSVILRETDSATLDDMIRGALFGSGGSGTGWCYLHEQCETIVRDYLRDTPKHKQRIAELRDEDRENSEDECFERAREEAS